MIYRSWTTKKNLAKCRKLAKEASATHGKSTLFKIQDFTLGTANISRVVSIISEELLQLSLNLQQLVFFTHHFPDTEVSLNSTPTCCFYQVHLILLHTSLGMLNSNAQVWDRYYCARNVNFFKSGVSIFKSREK